MSATVNRNPWGVLVGHCPACRETISGPSNMVYLWADVHNSDNHREEPV